MLFSTLAIRLVCARLSRRWRAVLSPSGEYSVLHGFTNGSDVGVPDDGLVMDGQGNLYGAASQAAQTRPMWCSRSLK